MFLVDPEEWDDGTVLNTMVGPPMQIHLRQDAQPFARNTPNSSPESSSLDGGY